MNVRGKGDKDDEVQVGVKVPLEGMGNVQDGGIDRVHIEVLMYYVEGPVKNFENLIAISLLPNHERVSGI